MVRVGVGWYYTQKRMVSAVPSLFSPGPIQFAPRSDSANRTMANPLPGPFDDTQCRVPATGLC